MTEKKKGEPYFDWVRGFACQVVLLGHCLSVIFPSIFMHRRPDGFMENRLDVPLIQNLGVIAFFAISGYLVTGSALSSFRHGRNLQDFLIARASRIFVPLWPFLILLFPIERKIYGEGGKSLYQALDLSWPALLANITMLFNNPALSFFSRKTGLALSYGSLGTAQQLWTVVIEWWLYVAFGLIAFAATRRTRWSGTKTIILLVAALPSVWSLVHGNGIVIAWVIGMLWRIYRDRLNRIVGTKLVTAIVALLVLAVLRAVQTDYHFYDPLFVTSVAGLLLLVSGDVHAPCPRIIAASSNISYSLYLLHLPVIVGAAAIFPTIRGNALTIPIAFVGCNILAYIYWLLIERHHHHVARWLSGLSGAYHLRW